MSQALKQKEYFVDEELLLSAQDLFSRRRFGHYIHHCFETKGQLLRWSKFMQTDDYYVTKNEPKIIPFAAFETNKLIYDKRGVVGVENGPGTLSAIKIKTVPYFKRLQFMHTYIGRDWSLGVCDSLPKNIQNFLPDVKVISDLSDFNNHCLPLNIPGTQKVFAEFGFSRTNLEGGPDAPYPIQVLQNDAFHLRKLMSSGDTYAMTVDSNADEKSILNSYSGAEIVEWGREHLREMKRRLPIEGDFDPESFTTAPLWFKDSWLCNNNFIPLRSMNFSIGGMGFTVSPNEYYAFTNQWKVPLDVIVPVYEKAGMKLKAIVKDEFNWVHIPIFQAT